MFAGVDEPRGGRVCCCQGFGQKSSGRLGVPIGREQKIDRRAGGVKSPVQVPPFAFHSDIGLLDSDAVFPATLAAIHPCVRLLQSADDLLLMISSSRHFSFLSCLQNSRKASQRYLKFSDISPFPVGGLVGRVQPLYYSAALRLLKVESDINGILPAGRRAPAIYFVSFLIRLRSALGRCKFGNYLRIRGGSRKLNANGRTLFANGVRRSVVLFEWLSPSMGLTTFLTMTRFGVSNGSVALATTRACRDPRITVCLTQLPPGETNPLSARARFPASTPSGRQGSDLVWRPVQGCAQVYVCPAPWQ